jgi:putative colanic acid biosynthesis acetyltransferase WcaF
MDFGLILGEIYVDEGAWVGAQSVVCPGVKMFSHSVLSVGFVANRDMEPYTIYRGNPATKVKIRVIV